MKFKNLLLISFFFVIVLNGCNNICNDKKEKIVSVKDTTLTTSVNENNQTLDSLEQKKDSILLLDSINPKLKVIINGMIYYKKNIGDYKYDNLMYQFYDVKEHKDYNIKTGEYIIGNATWEMDKVKTKQ